MRRIISKIDYDMHKLGEENPQLVLDAWYHICKNKMIINSATEIITDRNGNKCFLAPTICHMILSHPWDIDKEIYDKLILTLLKDCSLNKITVFNDMTFLSLIVLNGALGFDEWYLKLINKNIRNRTKDGNFEMRLVRYHEIPSDDEFVIGYETNDVNVSLTNSEMEAYSNGHAFEIDVTHSFKEVEKLAEIASLFPTLDEKFVSMINLYNQFAISYQRYQEQLKENATLKL